MPSGVKLKKKGKIAAGVALATLLSGVGVWISLQNGWL